MQNIRIISVGKLRVPHWKQAAMAYANRLHRGYALAETIIKDGDASLAPGERSAVEATRILQAIKGGEFVICLDETGDALSSETFATLLQNCFEGARTPCFIIGGAYGLTDTVRNKAARIISFGPMTFPHELARVLLLEQLYRADAIIHNRPYHHA